MVKDCQSTLTSRAEVRDANTERSILYNSHHAAWQRVGLRGVNDTVAVLLRIASRPFNFWGARKPALTLALFKRPTSLIALAAFCCGELL